MKCSSCGRESVEGAEYCIKCGSPISVARRCSKCGTLNLRGTTRCGECGAELLPSFAEEAGTEAPGKKCKWCGNTVGDDEEVCRECLSRSAETKVHDRTYRKKKKPSRRLTVCAIYLILTGIAAFGFGLALIFIDTLIVESFGYSTGVGACGALTAMLGLVSALGGALAVTRRQFLLVVIGSICSLLCTMLIAGSLLGIVGMALGVPIGMIGPVLLHPTKEEFGW